MDHGLTVWNKQEREHRVGGKEQRRTKWCDVKFQIETTEKNRGEGLPCDAVTRRGEAQSKFSACWGSRSYAISTAQLHAYVAPTCQQEESGAEATMSAFFIDPAPTQIRSILFHQPTHPASSPANCWKSSPGSHNLQRLPTCFQPWKHQLSACLSQHVILFIFNLEHLRLHSNLGLNKILEKSWTSSSFFLLSWNKYP